MYRKPTMFLVRHGSTDLNAENRFRGWTEVPLDDEGHAAADEIANYFSYQPIGEVASSDLTRSVQTAQAFALGIFDRNPNLRPWNLGDELTGQKKDKEHMRVLKHYIDNPDDVIPNGESLSQFRSRWESTLDDYLAQAVHADFPPVLVTHTSNIAATRSLYDPTYSDSPEQADIVEPGGVVCLYFNDDATVDMEPVLGAIVREQTEAS